jgi:hypothetical protein
LRAKYRSAGYIATVPATNPIAIQASFVVKSGSWEIWVVSVG